MNIAGLQKMTLLDYPGRVACTVFLNGCNFRCPFCHNSPLLPGTVPNGFTEEELLSFLAKRKGLLDGVCISGGEPTLAPDLPDFIRKIRGMGYPVKLDTNGFRPDVLRSLIGEGLLDYVAMDVKNSPVRYGETVGVPGLDIKKIEESLRILSENRVDYELRTTVVGEYHTETDVRQMGEWLSRLFGGPVKRIFLQPFKDGESVLAQGLHAPGAEEMESFLAAISPFAEFSAIRG